MLSTWEMPGRKSSQRPGSDHRLRGAEDKLKQLNSGVLEKLGVGGPSWKSRAGALRVNLRPWKTSSLPDNRRSRSKRLQASEAERFEADAELEYVELEDRRQEAAQQRRYLDEPQRYDERRYEEPSRYEERPPERTTRSYDEPAPYDEEPAYQEQASYEQQPPRRAMPASRRAVQQSSEPLDVEPMDDPTPPRQSQDLDDPW